MKKRSLLLAMSTLLLLCSCGGTTYTNDASMSESGVSISVENKLTLKDNGEFKLDILSITAFNDSAATKLDWDGAAKAETRDIASGTYEITEVSGNKLYTLTTTVVKSYIKISGKGKQDLKDQMEPSLEASYSAQEVVDLLAGKTITKKAEDGKNLGKIVVTIDEETKTFRGV